jgi:DNA-binding FadR family transcriptional regulator
LLEARRAIEGEACALAAQHIDEIQSRSFQNSSSRCAMKTSMMTS